MTGQVLEDITHTIQLSVAPVFLLTALGTTLSVFTARLARIVDRARRTEARIVGQDGDARTATVAELRMLERRARLIHWALTLGTSAALLVCLLIAVAFVAYLTEARAGTPMAVLFILAMCAYVAALICFLREIFWAIATLRFGLPAEVKEHAAPEGP